MEKKKYTVFVTDQAQLETTKQYYIQKLHAKDAAVSFIDSMEAAFSDLAIYPKRARLVEEEPWHSKHIRVKPVKRHNIYLWIDESAAVVWITAVIAGRMDQRKQLSRMKMS